MKHVIAGAVVVAAGTFLALWFFKTPVFRYNAHGAHQGRPHPTELIMKVESVRDIDEKTNAMNHPSITNYHFTKEAHGKSLNGRTIRLQFTQRDFENVGGVKAGDQIAVFGWEQSDGHVFRIEKYEPSKGPIESWFRDL